MKLQVDCKLRISAERLGMIRAIVVQVVEDQLLVASKLT